MTQIVTKTGKSVVNSAPLSALLPLRETTFNLPEHATRELDMVHVATLTGTDSSTWPPLKVVETDEGLAVIDGYHRWKARERQAIITATGLEDASPKEQDQAFSEVLPPDVLDLVENTLVLVEIGIYETEKEVAKAALTANLTHGLQPRGKARVAIALELYDLTRVDIPEPTQVDIARMVGINKATLNEYLKKREKEQAKEETSNTGKAENEDVTEDKGEGEKVLKQAQKLIKSLGKLYEEEPHAYTKVVQVLFPAIVDGMCDVYSEQNDKTYVDAVTTLISSQDGFSGNHSEHVNKLGKALVGAAKKLEKLSPQVVK